MSNVLEPNQELKQKTSLWSPNRAYELRLQDDGNLVMYHGTQPIWNAWESGWKDTAIKPNRDVVLKMQDDGNLVMYHNPGTVLWESDTVVGPGTNNHQLRLQDDGNLVIYESTGDSRLEQAKWDIRTGRLY